MSIFVMLIFGLAVGSFLNVLIDRLPRGESVFKGRSHCESCKKELAWHDLIPLVSFITLGGRCRYCHSPLGLYYPVVELLTAALFAFIFYFIVKGFMIYDLRFMIQLAYYLFVVSSLIVIFFTDLKYGIIPDQIIFSAIFISLLYLLLNTYYLIPSLLSAIGAFIFFLLIFLVTRGKGMGFGDVKYVFLAGLFLGFPKIVICLYLAFVIGALVSLILVAIGKKKFSKDTVPFGPFLVLGTLVAFLGGDRIINMLPFFRWL